MTSIQRIRENDAASLILAAGATALPDRTAAHQGGGRFETMTRIRTATGHLDR